MFKTWFIALPANIQVLIIIIVIVAVVVMSIYGKLAFSWGKAKLGLGGAALEPTTAGKTSSKQIEPCDACKNTIIDVVQEVDATLFTIKRDEMIRKMTLVEHKLISIQQRIVSEYNVYSNRRATENQNIDHFVTYIIEPNLFNARLELAMHELKMEFKRSIKENGFHEKQALELRIYIVEQIDTIDNILRAYLNINYPKTKVTVSYQDITSILDNTKKFIEEQVEEIYNTFVDIHKSANVKSDVEKQKIESIQVIK